MAEAYVTVERRPDQVALVRLDRPKANALSAEVLAQLQSTAEDLTADPPGAVVLWGGRRIFAAGADIVELGRAGAPAVGANFAGALGALAAVPRATIAAVNGFALGGGLELALACDFRVCAEDARFGLPEVLLGVIPGGGGTQRLPRLIGASRAKELIFTGRLVDAKEALAIRLADRVTSPDMLIADAVAWARELSQASSASIAFSKAILDRTFESTEEQIFALGREAQAVCYTTAEHRDAVTAFLEKTAR